MIFDRVENDSDYFVSVNGLKEAMRAIKNYPKENYNTGRVDVKAEKLFIRASEYETNELSEDSLMEAHKAYIDIMYMVEGEEIIYVKPTTQLQQIIKEYDPSIDALLGKVDADVTAVRLQKGQFVILFPQDAHCPACKASENTHVKKIIGKLSIDY